MGGGAKERRSGGAEECRILKMIRCSERRYLLAYRYRVSEGGDGWGCATATADAGWGERMGDGGRWVGVWMGVGVGVGVDCVRCAV